MDRIISAMDRKTLPITIFMDLSKAFDTLNHNTLLDKLYHYGIRGTALCWFKDYLTNRQQYVEIDDTAIDTRPTLVEIERVNIFNFLGITLDENVTWKPHISILSNKISKYSGILNRLKHYLPLHIMRMLYCSLVNSHLLYGILVWGYECHRLEKIQKRIIRIITVSKYNAHTEPLLKALDLLKLKDMLNLSSLKFYFRYQHDNSPAYFYSFQITTQGSHHHYNTRHSDQINVERTRTIYADKRVRIYLPNLVNSIPIPLLLTVSRVSHQTLLNTSSMNIQTYAP